MIVVLAVQAARLVWLLVLPVGPIGAAEASVSGSATINPSFAAQAFGPSPSGVVSADITGLTLMGIRRHPDAMLSSAILANAEGVQRSYGINDTVRPGLRLQAVHANQVTLSTPQGETRLLLAVPDGLASPSARYAPPSPTPQASTAPVDARRLVAEAGLRARMRNGQVDGYTLIPRGDGQTLRLAGLEPGDVLLAVNGEQLTPERVAELGDKLQSGGSTRVTVQRGQETQTITLHTEQP